MIDRWFDDYSRVLALGRWLVLQKSFDARELLAYFEKPWKWDPEWEEFIQTEGAVRWVVSRSEGKKDKR